MRKSSSQRVITAIWMMAIFIPFIFLGGWFFYGFCCAAALIGTFELTRIHVNKHNLNKNLLILVPLLSAGLPILVGYLDMTNAIRFSAVMLYLVLAVLILYILPLFSKNMKMTDAFYFVGSILYCGGGFTILSFVRNIDIYTSLNLHIGTLDLCASGLFIFGYVYLTTLMTDVGAYEIGRRFGKHKLIPEVSPNKTIEGSIGGTVFGTVIGSTALILLEVFFDFKLLSIEALWVRILLIILITFVLTIFIQMGDLIASKLKREYEIKDYSNLFPGHGGMMDRFDSALVAFTVFFIILAIAGYIL